LKATSAEDFLVGEDLALPFLSTLPRPGGQIKGTPEDFMVREIPLYEPCGSGDHVYLCLLYRDENTQDVARKLQKLFGLPADGLGFAGMKDRNSISEQYFSLYLPGKDTADVRTQIDAQFLPEHPGMELKMVSRHKNRLRRGHLAGNAFTIRLFNLAVPVDQALAAAEGIKAQLAESGYANYYGLQRFGGRGDNAARGFSWLKGEFRPQKHLVDLLESSLQSFVFNRWLAERIGDGLFSQLLPGDVMRKISSGGLFLAADLPLEQERLERRETCYTGPLPGRKLKHPESEARERESRLLAELGLIDMPWRSDGGRRDARVHPGDFSIRAEEHALLFSFTLPAGSYATVVLREFTGTDLR